jgi:hypothetical protein
MLHVEHFQRRRHPSASAAASSAASAQTSGLVKLRLAVAKKLPLFTSASKSGELA